MEGQEKILAPKIDGLWKHAGQYRALTNFEGMKKVEHSFLTTNQHVKNERRYFALNCTASCLRGCEKKKAEAGPISPSFLDPQPGTSNVKF